MQTLAVVVRGYFPTGAWGAEPPRSMEQGREQVIHRPEATGLAGPRVSPWERAPSRLRGSGRGRANSQPQQRPGGLPQVPLGCQGMPGTEAGGGGGEGTRGQRPQVGREGSGRSAGDSGGWQARGAETQAGTPGRGARGAWGGRGQARGGRRGDEGRREPKGGSGRGGAGGGRRRRGAHRGLPHLAVEVLLARRHLVLPVHRPSCPPARGDGAAGGSAGDSGSRAPERTGRDRTGRGGDGAARRRQRKAPAREMTSRLRRAGLRGGTKGGAGREGRGYGKAGRSSEWVGGD